MSPSIEDFDLSDAKPAETPEDTVTIWDLIEENVDLRDENKELNDKADELAREGLRISQLYAGLRTQFSTLRVRHVALSAERTKLTIRVAKLEDELVQLVKRHDRLRMKVADQDLSDETLDNPITT